MRLLRRAAVACCLLALVAGGGCFEPGPLGVGDDVADEPSGPDVPGVQPDAGGPEPDAAAPEDTEPGTPDVAPDAAADADVPTGPSCITDEQCTESSPDLCAGEVRCIDYTCQVDPDTAVTCPDDGDPCTESACDPATGQCVTESLCDCEPLSKALLCGQPYTFSTADPGDSAVLKDYPCGGGGGEGAEHVLRFTAAEAGNVALELRDGEVSGLWVLSDAEDGCDVDACVAGGTPPVVFGAQAGETYAVVVEHAPGPPVAVELRATCGVSAELDCDDGLDEDGDGATDCDDGDCAGTPACPPDHELDCADEIDDDDDGLTDCQDTEDCAQTFDCAQTCKVSPTTPSCGWSQGVGTGGGDASATDYICPNGTDSAPSKEVVYRFQTQQQKQVTVTLSAAFAGAGIYVLRDEGYGCSPNTCIGMDPASAAAPGVVSFPAEPGETYYLAVDGEATGIFDLSIACQ